MVGYLVSKIGTAEGVKGRTPENGESELKVHDPQPTMRGIYI